MEVKSMVSPGFKHDQAFKHGDYCHSFLLLGICHSQSEIKLWIINLILHWHLGKDTLNAIYEISDAPSRALFTIGTRWGANLLPSGRQCSIGRTESCHAWIQISTVQPFFLTHFTVGRKIQGFVAFVEKDALRHVHQRSQWAAGHSLNILCLVGRNLENNTHSQIFEITKYLLVI